MDFCCLWKWIGAVLRCCAAERMAIESGVSLCVQTQINKYHFLDEINFWLLVDVDPSSPMTAPPPTSSYWDRLDRYRKNYAQNPLWAFLWSGSGIFVYLQIIDFSTYTTA